MKEIDRSWLPPLEPKRPKSSLLDNITSILRTLREEDETVEAMITSTEKADSVEGSVRTDYTLVAAKIKHHAAIMGSQFSDVAEATVDEIRGRLPHAIKREIGMSRGQLAQRKAEFLALQAGESEPAPPAADSADDRPQWGAA